MALKEEQPSEPIKILNSETKPGEISLSDPTGKMTVGGEEDIAQQSIFDGILVHQILASYPDKSWLDILPELQLLNLAPVTLEAIAANIQAPVALDVLLEQLNGDRAMALLARCYIIAELDCVITEREDSIMNAIAAKFNLDLTMVEAAVNAELLKSDRD
ncbi:hypothetical protein BCD67_13915 [Oscillatoriales cyanobacterium USR001]|nr:hypothetical protein BCD67_13915 [Oscillatoriales cyanobacterium USR001]